MGPTRIYSHHQYLRSCLRPDVFPGLPQWVVDVILDVYRLTRTSKPLDITWRPPSGKYITSSGTTYISRHPRRISITAGTDEFDQGQVLLHELAHWLSRKGSHHGRTFYRMFWKLVRHFGLDEQKVLERERKYRKKAEIVYHETRNREREE